MFPARKLLLLLSCACVALALSARADDDSSTTPAKKPRKSLHDQFTGQQYGTAGCGLGSIVFADQPGMVQVVASTINGTFASQTFGISSGTSNCGESGGKRSQARLFIEVNENALAKDVSRGQGEALDAFAKLVGCPSQNLGPELKNNYDQIFSDKNDADGTTQAIFEVIHSNSQLQQCSTLGLG